MGIYAENIDHWEEWQREYQWGAFYIFPPELIMNEVNNLRAKCDPESARYCTAHISLSDTLRHPLTDRQINELHERLQTIEPFTIEYGPLVTYPPHPGVCFDIRPSDKFFSLRQAIHSTSMFSNSPLSRREIKPHMTIAEFGMTMESSERLKKELSGQVSAGTWLCDSISLAVPNSDFWFVEVAKIPIGRAVL